MSHPVIDFIAGLLDDAPNVHVPVGRKVLPITDERVPARRVAALFKTRLDDYVRQLETESSE